MPDLAFRLTAVRFAVPPLRQRREDIAPLAQALLERICARYQQRPVVLGPGALARLLQHNWPGNVRELASVLEAALLEADNGVIRPEDLPILSRHPKRARIRNPSNHLHRTSPSTPSSSTTSNTSSTSTAATNSAPRASSASAAPLSTASSPAKPTSRNNN